jgi:hypothetical protein
MIRNLAIFLLFLFGISYAGMMLAYGETDPCRALAVEEARRSVAPTPVAHFFSRIETRQMSRLQCSTDLATSWWDRLTK